VSKSNTISSDTLPKKHSLDRNVVSSSDEGKKSPRKKRFRMSKGKESQTEVAYIMQEEASRRIQFEAKMAEIAAQCLEELQAIRREIEIGKLR